MTKSPLILLLPLALAACAGSNDSARPQTIWVEDGPTVNCINVRQIRTFRVIDDQTIDFERNRSAAWRNRLPFRCSGLSFGQKIRLNNRTSQLCSFDSITPLSMMRGPNPPRCQLGQFQPLKRVPAPEPAAEKNRSDEHFATMLTESFML
jgi:hypothetical protein